MGFGKQLSSKGPKLSVADLPSDNSSLNTCISINSILYEFRGGGGTQIWGTKYMSIYLTSSDVTGERYSECTDEHYSLISQTH